MINLKNKYVKHSINILILLIGTFIMGTGYNIFYLPNNIIPGGFSGIATIVCHFLSMVNVNIPVSVVYLIFNVIIYLFAVKTLGKTFAIYGIIGILSYSLFLEICKFPAVSNDLLLCCIYGGVVSGLGVGLVIRSGGSTGGGDMLGCIINHLKPRISVGWVTIIINTMVVIISLISFGLNLSLYALISIFIAGKTGDLIIEGPKSIKAFYIISTKPNEMSKSLMNILHRGVTSFDAYGKYSGNKLEVILCLVSNHQIAELKKIIYEIDKDAFLFSVSVKEAMGKGFHKLEQQKPLIQIKRKNLKSTIPEQNFTLTPSCDENTQNKQDH